jgi:hypothetical protein
LVGAVWAWRRLEIDFPAGNQVEHAGRIQVNVTRSSDSVRECRGHTRA